MHTFTLLSLIYCDLAQESSSRAVLGGKQPFDLWLQTNLWWCLRLLHLCPLEREATPACVSAPRSDPSAVTAATWAPAHTNRPFPWTVAIWPPVFSCSGSLPYESQTWSWEAQSWRSLLCPHSQRNASSGVCFLVRPATGTRREREKRWHVYTVYYLLGLFAGCAHLLLTSD